MKTRVHKKQTRTQLPILIRYRAQDYETRYLDDPRALYIDEFREQHPDDGFLAIIPSEAATEALAQQDAGWDWPAVGLSVMTLGPLSWIAYRLFSLF